MTRRWCVLTYVPCFDLWVCMCILFRFFSSFCRLYLRRTLSKRKERISLRVFPESMWFLVTPLLKSLPIVRSWSDPVIVDDRLMFRFWDDAPVTSEIKRLLTVLLFRRYSVSHPSSGGRGPVSRTLVTPVLPEKLLPDPVDSPVNLFFFFF